MTEALFRELLVMYENSAPVAATQPSTSGESPDDGMVELLAADVSSLASRRIALPEAHICSPCACRQAPLLALLDPIAWS